MKRVFLLRGALAAAAFLSLTAGALAEEDEEVGKPNYPTTEFAEGARSATITVGPITAAVSLVRRKDIDPDFDAPLLRVMVDGQQVAEAAGLPSGLDYPAAEASIAEIDPTNAMKEVYFTSFSGGAHCCAGVTVAEEIAGKWVTVPVGYTDAAGAFRDFDGDGNYLQDIDGDGVAEIVTVDNRFLYTFDCYACSAAPLTILTVRAGKQLDISSEPRFLPAHRDWLRQIEDGVDPAEKWSSAGFLAGWVAAKSRLGQGAEAYGELVAHWDSKADTGEEVCLTGAELEKCPRKQRVTMKFPERLKRFLDESGYRF